MHDDIQFSFLNVAIKEEQLVSLAEEEQVKPIIDLYTADQDITSFLVEE
jgi:hypothetical protein